MSENKNIKRTRGVTLRTPKDLQRITAQVISDIFRAGQQVEHSGKIFQLGSVWLKAYEITKLEDIERRLVVLERDREARK
jgi:hypothetical protein